ncbi:ATP-grasp domain-containing protein [Desulfosporosinus youngiae]|uniref:Carbamoylphosphate synthase large subunit n=1 Tax=Desulfosporosinus youngiae DSM 17734 TaxID=768710 RepID=H5XZF9_9FIRM|nr:ATP-grasp domain-containing protein [Desulfosporosinus youngiae]EHQ91865.1 carbamoylphosphate synthase large subunit [Desulfosporosinus youngiae DSM 17734]
MKSNRFSGKKLLILGSNVGATDIVTYARANGAYTIVADYYSPENSAAKRVADEHILISTGDLGALSTLIQERKVDGVLAGISEFNLLNAMTLSDKFGLSFYCTKEQWDMVESKDQFRALCDRCGVPSPRTYYTGERIPDDIWARLHYPVVIKPVDGSTSAGVSICQTEKELRDAEPVAIKNSIAGKLILEEYIKGHEFTAHYTICNGIPYLACIDNRYPVAINKGLVTTIPIARIYPSLFLEKYMIQVNESMLNLCREIGIQNGVLFIQGLHGNDGFSIFEAGLRCAGEAPYRFIEKLNGINFMDILVDQALLGKVESYDSAKEDPLLKGKCCGIVSFATKGGKVGAIRGLKEAVVSTPSVIEYECRYPEGADTPYGNTLRQLHIRFVMICESREQMAKDVQYLNETITVLNDKGENMCLRFEPNRLFEVL